MIDWTLIVLSYLNYKILIVMLYDADYIEYKVLKSKVYLQKIKVDIINQLIWNIIFLFMTIFVYKKSDFYRY